MNFWSRFIAWLKSVVAGGSNRPAALKRKIYRDIARREEQIRAYKNALAGLVAQQQKLIVRVRGYSDEVQKLENLKHAAAVSTRDLVSRLRAEGRDAEAIRADAEYTKNLLAFQRFSHQAAQLNGQIEEQEAQVQALEVSVGEHKRMIRELIDLQRAARMEVDDALFQIKTAEAETEVYEQLVAQAGNLGEPAALTELREARHRARAEARVARDSVQLQSALEGVDAENPPEIGFDALVGLE